MPYHLKPYPVSATNLSLKDKTGETYPVLLDTDTFDRASEDGDIPILPICGGDEYVGESLEGQWHKGWDANISTFTATISGGTLRMTGVAAIAGTGGYGWINNHHPVPLLDELELTISMESPIDDTGATADRDIALDFFLIQDKNELNPHVDNNYIRVGFNVDETGLILRIFKEVNGANSLLDSGYDYTMDGTRGTGNLEATIWRIIFNSKPGTTGATMSIYLKQAATLALAEVATENELDGSPYDISDLAFNMAYPAFSSYTQNTTYFGTTYDSANRAASTYLRVSYPSQFYANYDFTEASYGLGEVEVHDGTPSTATRIYDEDHEFSSDCYIQNSLIRLWVDELASNGLSYYSYYDAAYNLAGNLYGYLATSVTALTYPHLRSITYISPEKTIIKIRLLDSATINEDYYMDLSMTLKRGDLYSLISIDAVYPLQDYRIYFQTNPSTRFGYAGDNDIGDDDLNITATNGTMTDNFMTSFDDTNKGLIFYGLNMFPDSGFTIFEGRRFYTIDNLIEDIESALYYIGISPFSNNSDLFKEAEDATLSGGATAVVDAAASNGEAAMLDAQNEAVTYNVTAGTDLPAGRYLAVFRIRDINQVADDIVMSLRNSIDGVFRSEKAVNIRKTVTATYAYYSEFFHISDTDVSGTDNIQLQIYKGTANANEIYVDYILIIPIGDGMNWSQDLSHSALRGITQHPRICER